MKPLVTLALPCALLASCANPTTERVIADSLGGAAGAIIGHKTSNGDKGWTAAGAAGGVLISEGIQHLGNKKAKKAYDTGYDKGRSDAVRQQYWMMVDDQKSDPQSDAFSFYEFPIPGHQSAGATILPSLRTLRINE